MSLALLHDDGQPFILTITRKEPDGSTKARNVQYSDFEAAMKFAAKINRGGFNVFVKHASFNGERTPQGAPRCRLQNVTGSRTLFVDVDAGAGTPYPSADEAWDHLATAVDNLAQSKSLPPYNLVIESGHGIHAGWVLEEPVAPQMWKIWQHGLHTYLQEQGVAVDLGVEAIDKGFRLAGNTYVRHQFVNYKPPRALVNCAFEGPRIPNAFLQKIFSGRNILRVVGKPDNSEFEIERDPEHEFKFNIEEVIDECPVLAEARDTQGKGLSLHPSIKHDYDLWQRLVAQAARDNDEERGAYWAHEFSRGDDRYQPEEVDAKIADARQHETLITCKEFSRYSPLCRSCKWFGRINSVGMIPKLLRASAGAALVLPDRRYQNIDGGVMRVSPVDGEEDQKKLMLPGYFLGNFTLFEAADSDAREVGFEAHPIGSSRVMHIRLPLSETSTTRTLIPALGKAGLTVSAAYHIGLQAMVADFLTRIRQSDATTTRYTQLGWNQARSEFVTGAACHTTKGRIAYDVPENLKQFEPVGDRAKYHKVATLLLQHEPRPEIHMMHSASMGSALLELTGINGMVANFWSGGSGHGKTTHMHLAAAQWGNPAKLVGSTLDTDNARMAMAALNRNIPQYMDDMVADTIRANHGTFLRQVSQGTEKRRLNSQAQLQNTSSWRTMFILNSNTPISATVMSAGFLDPAIAARYWDIQVPAFVPRDANTQVAVDNARHILEHNYGWIGPEFIDLVMANLPAIKAALGRMQASFIATIRLAVNDTAGRFHAATAAAMVIAASLARKLIPVNAALVHQGCVHWLLEAKRQRRGADADSSPENIMRRFLDEFVGNRVSMMAGANSRRYLVRDHPPVHGTPVYEADRGNNRIVIDQRAFTLYVAKHNQDITAVKLALVNGHGLKMGKAAIGAGTVYSTTRTEVLVLPAGPNTLWHSLMGGDQ